MYLRMSGMLLMSLCTVYGVGRLGWIALRSNFGWRNSEYDREEERRIYEDIRRREI